MDATDDPASIGVVDVVVLTVKTYQLEVAVEQMRPLIGAETMVICLQNGVTAADRTGAIIGREQVVGYSTDMPTNAIGELDGPVSDRVRKLQSVLSDAGWKVEAADDIKMSLWQKAAAHAAVAQ